MPAPNFVDPQFESEIETVRKKIGRQKLADEDLVILACEEISRTSTREEKNYSA